SRLIRVARERKALSRVDTATRFGRPTAATVKGSGARQSVCEHEPGRDRSNNKCLGALNNWHRFWREPQGCRMPSRPDYEAASLPFVPPYLSKSARSVHCGDYSLGLT